jgi:hypothetical protein
MSPTKAHGDPLDGYFGQVSKFHKIVRDNRLAYSHVARQVVLNPIVANSTCL